MPDSMELRTFRWTEAYAVGDAEVDAEHRGLFAVGERFERAMLEGKGKDILRELLVQLVRYASEHFAHEEQLMARIKFPGLPEHRKEHEGLRRRVEVMMDRAEAGEITMTIETMQFVMGWIERHVLGSDLAIGKFLKQAEFAAESLTPGGTA